MGARFVCERAARFRIRIAITVCGDNTFSFSMVPIPVVG